MTYRILLVLNNNTVLVRDGEGQDCVAAGKGVGFQRKAGQIVDRSAVERVYYPDDARGGGVLGDLIAAIPPAHLVAAEAGLEVARRSLPGFTFSSSAIVSLADHIGFAITRRERGLDVGSPLSHEVAYLYPDEHRIAHEVVSAIDDLLATDLGDDEAAAVTLHLVNATFSATNLSASVGLGELLVEIFDVLEAAFPDTIDRRSVSAARFITHLRYLFVRARSAQQWHGRGALDLLGPLRDTHATELIVAARVRALIELRLGFALSDDERSYLALHVIRIVRES